MQKIFITGGTGFLGSYILRKLVKRGYQVRALKRPTSRMHLVEDVKDQVEWVEGDILDIPALEDAMEDIDVVYHGAAIVSFAPKDRKRMLQINVEGTANVVNVALYRNIKKLGYVSSIAAIGRLPDSHLVDENTKWENNKINTQYAISKYLAEQEVWRGTVEGLPAVMINPTIIVGAGYWNETSVKLFKQIDEGLKFYTEGETGFVDVRDTAEILIRLVESEIQNERYVVNAENMAYRNFMENIAIALDKQPPSIKATPTMREIVWRIEWLRYKLTGRNPLITKETAKMAANKYQYINKKIVDTLDYQFKPINTSIKETAEVLQKSKVAGTNFGVFSV